MSGRGRRRSGEGIESALLCGEALRAYPITKMVTSDMGRTIETAEKIMEVLCFHEKPIRMPEFRETFFGSFEGEPGDIVWKKVAKRAGFQTVGELFSNASVSEIMNYFHAADETGDAEDYETFRHRLLEGLRILQERFEEEDHVVIVTHGNTIRNIAYLFDENVPLGEELVNAGISILELRGEEKRILTYNNKPYTPNTEDVK